MSLADAKSTATELKSSRSSARLSSVTAINKLQSQLEEEKREREKMQREIEELKKINNDLCSALLNPSTKKSESSPLKVAKIKQWLVLTKCFNILIEA